MKATRSGKINENSAERTALGAIVQSGTVLSDNAERLFEEWADISRARIARGLDRVNALLQCRTPQDLIALQAELLRDNMETLLGYGGDRGEEIGRTVEADLRALREDLNNLTEDVGKLFSKTKDDAAKSMRDLTSNMTDRVGSMVGDLAETSSNAASVAASQVKSFGAELQSMAHRNPFGTLTGAVLVGILIGMLGRRS